jgi:hypothetical protein
MNFLLENANARVHAQEPKLTHVSPLSLLELKVAEEDPQGIETYNRNKLLSLYELINNNSPQALLSVLS